jgi:hypothetical protein
MQLALALDPASILFHILSYLLSPATYPKYAI